MSILSKPKSVTSKPSKSNISSKPLHLSYTNIRGLRKNLAAAQGFLANSSPDLLAISESKLTLLVTDEDLNVPDCLPIIRKDAPNDKHGLAIYVKSLLPISRQLDFEELTLHVLSSLSSPFYYRSPSNQDCTVIDTILDNIDKILLDHPSANIFVCGDFNAHNIDWIPNDFKTDEAGKNCEAFLVLPKW